MNVKLITLLEKLSAIGGNHQTDQLLKLREAFLDYLKEHALDLFENPKEHVIARDAVLFIDAVNIRSSTADKKEAYLIARPVLNRLATLRDWNFYEIKLFIGLCSYTATFEEALVFTTQAWRELEKFNREPQYLTALTALQCNFTLRLLESKYFDPLSDQEQLALEKLFSHYMAEALHICRSRPDLKQVLLVRRGLFEQDQLAIDTATTKLSEVIENQAILEAVLHEVDFYLHSKEYQNMNDKEEAC